MSNKHFQIELLPILRTIIKEIVPNNLAKLSLFLLTGRIVPSPFLQSFGYNGSSIKYANVFEKLTYLTP